MPDYVNVYTLEYMFYITSVNVRFDAVYFTVQSMLRRGLVLYRVRRHLADRNMTLVTGMEVGVRRRAGARPGVAQK